MKREAPVLGTGKDPVEHERVDVDIEIERPAKPLHDGHAAATRVHDTLRASPVSQVAVHLAEQHPHDRFAQIVTPGQQVPDSWRQAQDPLSDGDIGEHVVHQVRGSLGHPPPAAARAEASPLAGKSPQSIQAAAAPESGESPGEPPTPEVRLELLFHETRQALAVAQVGRLGPERLEVLAHDLIQNAPAGRARRVLDRRQGHAIDRGRWRTTRR